MFNFFIIFFVIKTQNASGKKMGEDDSEQN